MQDTIEREILISAEQKKVFEAITEVSQIIRWFPDSVEGSLKVGEHSVLVFNDGEHRSKIFVEDSQPYSYFAYRWVPGGATEEVDPIENPSTLVEFFIEAEGVATKVVLKESGFASLPESVAEQSLADNTGGWTFMLSRLEKLGSS